MSIAKIMVVDDEEFICNLLKRTLSKHGYRVTPYVDSRAALRCIQGKEAFDVIITDIRMPHIDGFRLLEITKKRNVIADMLTAHALSPESTFKSFREGAASYVPKEKMDHITTYLNDVLEAKERGKHF